MDSLLCQLTPYKNINYFNTYFKILCQIKLDKNSYFSNTKLNIYKLFAILISEVFHSIYLYLVEPVSLLNQFAHYDLFRLFHSIPEFYILKSTVEIMGLYMLYLVYFKTSQNNSFLLVQRIIIFKQKSWFLQPKHSSGVPICIYFIRYTVFLANVLQNVNLIAGK